MNAFSYGSGLGFAAPTLTEDYVAGINPTISNGSVEVNGASFTYSGTTQYAYLDDNGVWQAASSPSSNTAYFGVGQTSELVGFGQQRGSARPTPRPTETGSAGRPTSAAAARTCTITASITATAQRTAASGRRRAAATVTRPAAAR